MSQDSCAAGHCWTLDYKVQCELCEPLPSLWARLPGDHAGHSFTRPEGPVLCSSLIPLPLGIGSTETGSHSTSKR